MKTRPNLRRKSPSLATWTANSLSDKRAVVPVPPAPEFIFFCDETGNSGSRFFDTEQPVYAEGGWIIPAGRVAEARSVVLELEAAAHFSPSTKGGRLKRSQRGLAYIASIAERLAAIGRPSIYLVEKRYAACVKAVETFFDPKYNPTVPPTETWDVDVRQARAEVFYATASSFIESFATAYRGRDPVGVQEAGKDWRDCFLESGDVPIALSLDASLPRMVEHMAAEFSVLVSDRVPSGYDSLNLPALVRTFQLIDEGVPGCEMVHDECATFEVAYTHAFERLRQAKRSRIEFADGRSHAVGFDRLQALSFDRSEAEPLLRAADYLVAACVEFARVAVNREKASREIRVCAAHILGPINRAAIARSRGDRRVPQLAEIFASEAWASRVFAGSFRRPPCI